MRIVVAGASGFLGRHIVRALTGRGDSVTTLVRRAPAASHEQAWNPATGVLPAAALDGAEAVINLCGAGIADRRWTASRKAVLQSSRIEPTTLLAAACARHGVPAFISGSAVGFYGDRGDEVVTESTGRGDGFLAQLCADWEDATVTASDGGVRVVRLRTGLVLGPDGGMLPRVRLLTLAMLGGRLGSGRQWWPWISVADYSAAILFLLQSTASGAINMTAPQPVTNATFTAQLAAVLHRPAPWVIPNFAIRAALGEFAGGVLGGQRAVPQALLNAGFGFLHPDLKTTLCAFAL
ncbi:MAG: TIGR01777 family oxidoreductase [Nakamurella sp.]